MHLIPFVGLRTFVMVEIDHDFYHPSQLKPHLGNNGPFSSRNGTTYGRGDGSVGLS
jgi:hypothetical protein